MENISLITRLTDGHLSERWVGKITIGNGGRECALISKEKGEQKDVQGEKVEQS